MPSTLLTGANSFFAAHLINQLISDRHTVTGTVRSLSKGDQLLSIHPEWKDKLKFIEVPHLAQHGVWDAVFQNGDFDYVIHNAAPVPSNPTNSDFDRDFLEPAMLGDLELLKSAKSHGSNVKNITFVGSVNAITDGSQEQLANKVFTNKDWNPLTPEDARRLQHPVISYCVSKKESERAIWDFVETNKPRFTVTVFLPCLIMGPALHYVDDINHINFTNDFFYSYFNGTNDRIPPTHFPSYIDARDLALAHVRALTTPAAANKRFLIGGFPYSAAAAISSLRNTLPELSARLPSKPAEKEDTRSFDADVSEADAVFKIKYRPADETFRDIALKLLELEKQLAPVAA